MTSQQRPCGHVGLRCGAGRAARIRAVCPLLALLGWRWRERWLPFEGHVSRVSWRRDDLSSLQLGVY